MLGVFPSITKPLFECVLFVLNIKFTSLIFYTCFQGKKFPTLLILHVSISIPILTY